MTLINSSDLRLSVLKFLIRDLYPGTPVIAREDSLIVKLDLNDDDWHCDYQMAIFYKPSVDPQILVLHPEIVPQLSFHMYPDRSLCLYHRSDYNPWHKPSILGHIIPWAIEWVFFYELWLVNGNIWLGKEKAHGS